MPATHSSLPNQATAGPASRILFGAVLLREFMFSSTVQLAEVKNYFPFESFEGKAFITGKFGNFHLNFTRIYLFLCHVIPQKYFLTILSI